MSAYPQAYVLVGPTASGKSAVAQLLAEQNGAPVVSADSMNIYRGMDIGTAKPSKAARASVPYYGLDLAEPTETFSVGDWLAAIRPAFTPKGAKGVSPIISASDTKIIGLTPSVASDTKIIGLTPSVPVVAGGTGLYLKCLLQGLADRPAADETLRARAEQMTRAELQAEAQRAAPEAYAALADKKNPRRLVRLLEHGGVSGDWKQESPAVIGLHVERDVLHQRIAQRVDNMYASGLLDEARGLLDRELSSTAQHAIGYAEAFAVLKNKMTVAEAKERTVIRTRQLAKRQRTWLRHQLNVKWIDTRNTRSLEKLAAEISNSWEKVPVSLQSGIR